MKQFRVLNLQSETPEESDLVEVAKAYPARECQHLEQSTLGFRDLPGMSGERVMRLEGSTFLYAELLRFRRSVPAAVRDREVRKRVKRMSDNGEEITAKLRKQLKDEVTAELLPKMPQMEAVIPLVFDIKGKQVWVGATSDSIVDRVFQLLRNAGLSIITELWFEGVDITRWMHEWFLSKQDLPSDINLGVKAKLADPDEPRATITISNEELSDEELQAVAESRSVVALELSSPGTSFVLGHDGSFKSLKFESDADFDDLAHETAVKLTEFSAALNRLITCVSA